MPDGALFRELISWFVLLLSCGFGNPIPEELMLVSGGIRAAHMPEEFGLFRWLMLPVCLLGGVGADVVLYFAGRLFGSRLLETRLMRRLSPPTTRDRIHHNFDRYGILIFVVGRLMPGIRTTLFLTAGTMRLNLFRFILADGIGALVGGGLFFLLGYGLGAQFEELLKHLKEQIHPYQPVILLTLLSAIVLYFTWTFFRHPVPTGDPQEVPLIGPQIAAHLPERREASAAESFPEGASGGQVSEKSAG